MSPPSRLGFALNEEQHAILEFMAPAHGEGLTLAHDIAASVGITPRAMGAKLGGLERKGLVRRRVFRKRSSMRTDHLYGWEITDAGWDAVAR